MQFWKISMNRRAPMSMGRLQYLGQILRNIDAPTDETPAGTERETQPAGRPIDQP